jgi:serine protease Do
MSTYRLRGLRLPLLLAVLGILAYVQWSRNREPAPKEWMTTPADQEALRSMQERIQSATRRVMPAVVAVEEARAASAPSGTEKPRDPERYASGVIVTADGLILSQAHVTHMLSGWDGRKSPVCRRPGERTTVILSDGRRIEAELLGADLTFDLSLLRLLEPGPYPHLPLDHSASVELGDWVLKLGHPTGYHRDRPPVVRLGRVLFQNRDIIVTDCLIIGGDSGGPFVDLEGRLVGILHDSEVPGKLKIPWMSLGSGSARIKTWSSLGNRFIQHRLDGMLRREIAPFDQKGSERFQESYHRVEDDEILPRDQWTQGSVIVEALQGIIRNTRRSVATILDEADQNVSLGTILEPDGWIVTVASTLPGDPRCRLSDARVLAAHVVGVDPAFDLALLKVQGTNLSPINWAEKPPPVAGTILAGVGMSETPLAIGVVSVPRRDLPGPFPTRVARRGATRPAVFGKPTAQGYLVDTVRSGEAYEAGIRPGDVILTIAGRDIRDDEDVLNCVRGRVEGERVTVGVLRDGRQQDLILSLVAETKSSGFPILFEHDMPLAADECGGPVVDLAGEVVGITFYRGQYGCMAIPGDCVKQLLPVLKSSGLSDKWIKPPPASPTDHEPSGADEKPRKVTNQRTR